MRVWSLVTAAASAGLSRADLAEAGRQAKACMEQTRRAPRTPTESSPLRVPEEVPR